MNKLIILTVLFCCFQAIITAHSENKLYNLQNNLIRQFDNKCKAPGLTCKNCDTLMFCIETEPGKFEENIVQKCKTPDETCLIDRCAKEPNPRCPTPNGNTFICTGTGVFPDPFDCSSYHVCIEKEQIISDESVPVNDLYAAVKCPDNWGYNPITTYCDIRLPEGFCPNTPPIPTCNTIGHIGSITGTSIYYICTTDINGVLRPILHICPHGNVIDTSGKCQAQRPPTTTTTTTETTYIPTEYSTAMSV